MIKEIAMSAVALTFSFGEAYAGDALTAFDVAEDLSRFVFASAPVHDDGMPAYGNVFVTQGYIYPAGTLDGGVEGTLEDGSPAFPDLVLGTWTCDGVFVGDGMYTKAGTMLISRQVFQFEDGDILITQGGELVDEGVVALRAITGGTGHYAQIGAEMSQILLGMSDGYGVRLQFEIGGFGDRAGLLVPDGSDDTSARPWMSATTLSEAKS